MLKVVMALVAVGLGAAGLSVAFRIADAPSLHIVSASYGANCGASLGNVTTLVRIACQRTMSCDYVVDVNKLLNPNPACAKAFQVNYHCPGDSTIYSEEVPGEAGLGSHVLLQCFARGSIRVLSATYGRSCGAPAGNASAALRRACNTKSDCKYTIDVNRLGDAAPGCEKDFNTEYTCTGEFRTRMLSVPAEAGLGSVVHLECN